MKIFSSFILQFLVSIIRMLIVGGGIAFLVLLNINQFLKTAYGDINLVIILIAVSFFPVFFAIFFEILFHERRKQKRKKMKFKALYTNA